LRRSSPPAVDRCAGQAGLRGRESRIAHISITKAGTDSSEMLTGQADQV
jgi:hypothetical protein